jgi:hypothetical protein
MANTKISALGAVDALAAGDKFPIADASDLTATKSSTITQLATLLQTTPSSRYVHVSLSSGATTTAANTTPVSVTNAVFTYATNSTYWIRVMGRLNSTAATTGAALQFDLSSAVTAIDVFGGNLLASSGTASFFAGVADDTTLGTGTSGVPTGPVDVPIYADAILVTTGNTGTCQLRIRSETTAVTELMAGAVMVVEKLI